MTPHNEAAKGDYAETVLLPGDPQRAEWIAENFLDDVRCVNRWRSEPGFTGSFRGVPVSVQSTGMGTPSLAIYVHELLDAYRVRTLIRIGTCGGLSDSGRAAQPGHFAGGERRQHDQPPAVRTVRAMRPAPTFRCSGWPPTAPSRPASSTPSDARHRATSSTTPMR